MTKIVSYNVNGIRAALKKGWLNWAEEENADIICLQEIKAEAGQLDLGLFAKAGYEHHYWHSAVKKGYSGVAILSRKKPKHVAVGCGNKTYDSEGRVLRADYGDFSVMSLYLPSGTTGEVRQNFKYKMMDFFQKYIYKLRKEKPDLIICGDWNICHKEIDIHNPVSNAKSSGFLPDERKWIGQFMDGGFIDSFRHFNKEPHRYTWWSQRFKARDRNLGWRIDYAMVADSLKKDMVSASILADVHHSDHCPIALTIR